MADQLRASQTTTVWLHSRAKQDNKSLQCREYIHCAWRSGDECVSESKRDQATEYGDLLRTSRMSGLQHLRDDHCHILH